MDVVANELRIPKKQLRAVKSTSNNRFEGIVHKLWLKLLLQHGNIQSSCPEVVDIFEWPTRVCGRWQKIFITVCKYI